MRLTKIAQGVSLFFVVAGCCADIPKNHPTPTLLAPGQSIAIKISPRRKEQPTGLLVNAGENYSISPAPCHRWVDFFIPCTAAGYMTRWTEWYMRGFECKKPLPNRPWLALVARIGNTNSLPFFVGTNWTGTPDHSGELFLFANDAAGWYWNNFGSMPVTITRIK